MRSITIAALAVLALPLVSFSSTARADSNDLMNQARSSSTTATIAMPTSAAATTRCAASRRNGIGKAGAASTTGT